MYSKVILIVLLAAAYAKAQLDNKICACDTEQDIKDNKNLWQLLKELSGDVSDEAKAMYAVSPGNLYQFDCSHCDEKLRKKRKITVETAEPVPAPVEPESVKEGVAEENALIEEVAEEGDREKRTISIHDVRCPTGYVLMYRFCIPESEIEELTDDVTEE